MFFKSKKEKIKVLNIEFDGKPKFELAVCENHDGNLVVQTEALSADIFKDEDRLSDCIFCSAYAINWDYNI